MGEQMMDDIKKFTKKILNKTTLVIILSVLAVALAVILIVSLKPKEEKEVEEPSIINVSTLEKILEVNDLSTLEAIYNGIARVKNAENPEEIDYYVAYEATVKAGIDFKEVTITVNEESKVIIAELPEVKITDVTVDIGTMDYIFMNDNANTEDVSGDAYKRCIEDVTNESKTQSTIYDLARENAKNIVEALIRPFVKSLDDEYKVEIR